jgi:hypothetical protein
VTHSLLVGCLGALLVTHSHRNRLTGGLLGLGLVGALALAMGASSGLIVAAFLLAGGAVAALGAHLGLSTRSILAVALLGFLTHPFGDLLTGTPPPLLAPLETGFLTTRIAPFTDPTLNLLLAFGVELAVIWFGVWTLSRTAGHHLKPAINPRAALGASAAVAVFVLTPPTMAASAHFVLPTVALGTVGVLPRGLPPRRPVAPLTAIVTGLAAITVAVATYTGVYLLV